MIARFQFDPSQCRITVQAFAAGMLSFLGHSPTFAVQEFTGELQLDPGPPAMARLSLIIKPESLSVIENVSPADRREIESRMRHEVLAVDRYRDIRFESNEIAARPVAPNQFRLGIRGELTLRDVARQLAISADMTLDGDRVRLTGETSLPLSSFQIAPVTALGGTLRLKDQLRILFDLRGVGVRDAVPTAEGTI